MTFHVYILYSPGHDKYYIGQTGDLSQRIQAHNYTSESSYTSKYRPWVLKIAIEVQSRSIAMKIEKYLKKKNRDFINRVIEEQDLREFIAAQHS